MPETAWKNVDEIAAYLQVRRETIYTWISDKHMPAHRVGRRWRFDMNEVDAWVRSGKAADWSMKGEEE